MRKHCTMCGKRLELWERVWGRFDHSRCRSTTQVRNPVSFSLFRHHPVQRVLRPGEESLEYQSAGHPIFRAAKESTLWQRSA